VHPHLKGIEAPAFDLLWRWTRELRLVWENHHEKGTSYSVTVNRRYRDKDENWQTTTSFGRDDLLILAKVIDLAHTRVIELQAERW